MESERTLDFWHNRLQERGFERDIGFNSSDRFVWWKCGGTHIGYDASDFHDGLQPLFAIEFRGIRCMVRLGLSGMRGGQLCGVLYQRHEDVVIDWEEFLFVVDALFEPWKLPMCMGYGWVSGIVSAVLRHSAVEVASTTGQRR